MQVNLYLYTGKPFQLSWWDENPVSHSSFLYFSHSL
jgi:hypothetical protein